MNWQVVFYMDDEGNEPVKDFILAQSDNAIAEIIHVFKLLRIFNLNLGMPYVRKIDRSGLRELRIRHGSNLFRIFYFAMIGKKFILLHGILKKEERIPRTEIEIATKRMNDQLSRS